MGRKSLGIVAAAAVLALVAIGLFTLRSAPDAGPSGGAAAGRPSRGGELTAAIRQDPPTFNRYAERGGDNTVAALSHLLWGRLVRVNPETGELEPWLAERWSPSSDGLTWTLTLRDGLRWSDGRPFSAADVTFSFEALYDERSPSSIRSSMLVGGRPLGVAAPDARTVVLTFPAPFGPALRILDNLVIYPRHKLEPALRAGTFAEAWGVATPPADIVSLGPFRLASYTPAERIVLERNPHYWRREGDEQLPFLDGLTLAIVRDPNTEILRIRGGQIDISSREVRPEDLAALRRDEAEGRVQLAEAGVGLDPNMLWFNLRPDAHANDPRRAWLQSEDFRKAISHAVDRQALVDQVYLGAGVPIYGPVTPGAKEWYVDDLPRFAYDSARARAILTGTLGFQDANGDGLLEDRGGRPVRFSILTQQQDTIRLRTSSVLQAQLRRAGIEVDVVGLDPGSIVERWSAGQYDAIYFGVEASSHDPANNLDFWLSSGGFHVWHAGQQTPATDWEARIDALMQRQIATTDQAERRRLYAEAQRIFAEHVPILYFAAPRIVVAMSPKVANARPVPIKPSILWSADTLGARR